MTREIPIYAGLTQPVIVPQRLHSVTSTTSLRGLGQTGQCTRAPSAPAVDEAQAVRQRPDPLAHPAGREKVWSTRQEARIVPSWQPLPRLPRNWRRSPRRWDSSKPTSTNATSAPRSWNSLLRWGNAYAGTRLLAHPAVGPARTRHRAVDPLTTSILEIVITAEWPLSPRRCAPPWRVLGRRPRKLWCRAPSRR